MEVSICRPMVPASPPPLVGAQSFPVGSTGTERDLATPLQHCQHLPVPWLGTPSRAGLGLWHGDMGHINLFWSDTHQSPFLSGSGRHLPP